MIKPTLSIDLMQDKVVVHITGRIAAVSWDRPNLEANRKLLNKEMANLREMQKNNQTSGGPFRDAVERIGRTLFESIFVHTEKQRLSHLYEQCIAQGSPSDISICFTVDEDSLSLPIEFIRDKDVAPLAARFPVYKTVLTTSTYPPRDDKFSGKMKVLLMNSNIRLLDKDTVQVGDHAGGREKKLNIYLPNVDEIDRQDGEIYEIEKALKQAASENNLEIDFDFCPSDKMDYETFQKKIALNKYDMIHYVGHGYYNEETSENFLFFKKSQSDNKIVALRGSDLGDKLKTQENLKLVYLSCCQSGAVQESASVYLSTFTGLLESVALAGIPNVIGMRWPITPGDAKILATQFYRALFPKGSTATVEEALMRARSATVNFDDQSVWCSPILVKEIL